MLHSPSVLPCPAHTRLLPSMHVAIVQGREARRCHRGPGRGKRGAFVPPHDLCSCAVTLHEAPKLLHAADGRRGRCREVQQAHCARDITAQRGVPQALASHGRSSHRGGFLMAIAGRQHRQCPCIAPWPDRLPVVVGTIRSRSTVRADVQRGPGELSLQYTLQMCTDTSSFRGSHFLMHLWMLAGVWHCLRGHGLAYLCHAQAHPQHDEAPVAEHAHQRVRLRQGAFLPQHMGLLHAG